MSEQPKPTTGKDGKDYPLTPKQEAFCRAYMETGNATESYRRVYGCKGWSDIAVNVKGSNAIANPKIKARLAELGQETAAKVQVSIEWFVDRLIKRADAADRAGDRNGATQAEALATKLLGMQVDKVDQTVRQAKPSDHRPDLQGIRQRISGAECGTAPAAEAKTPDKSVH